MAKIKLALGLDIVTPPHEMGATEEGFTYCQKLQNYIARNKKITKIGGTEAYNSTALLNPITWTHRSYHKLADNTFRKVAFAFSNGVIYVGDDVDGTLTENQTGFNVNAKPTHFTQQVAGNSTLFFISGEDEVYKYDGNGTYIWNQTSISSDLGRIPTMGVMHLDKAWYVSKDSSTVAYSVVLEPENFTVSEGAGEIVIGEEKDSSVIAIVVGGDETLYAFKDNAIYQLWGRTTSQFQFRRLTNEYGLADKRAIYPVANGFIFLDSFTKELYFFDGTSKVKPLTEKRIRLRNIIDKTQLDEFCMTVHDGLFRCAFKHREDAIYPDRELIYAIADPSPDGTPRWSISKGAKIGCYSVWNRQGDKNILVTGRVDAGKLMYHNRGNDFDGTAIETIVRTSEIVASEDKVVRFKGFYVKGKPGSIHKQSTFKYFLDGRYSDRGEQGLDMDGETRTAGELKISTQYLFNDRIIPFDNKSRGNSISFEIYDNNTGTFMEMYSISVKTQERYKLRNQLI